MGPLSEEEYAALKASIAMRGVEIPLVVDVEGEVIDGHHRRRAVAELRTEGHEISDPPEIVREDLQTEAEKRDEAWRLNMQRRHLNQAQKRGVIAAKLRESPEWANNRIASLLGVDGNTVNAVCLEREATSEIPKLERLVGADGKERARSYTDSIPITQERAEGPVRWAGVQPIPIEQPVAPPEGTRAYEETPASEEEPVLSAEEEPVLSDEEEALRKQLAVLGGEEPAVPINIERHKNLVEWAKRRGLYQRVDRRTDWGNPFVLDKDAPGGMGDGDRDYCLQSHRDFYLPRKKSLHNRLDEIDGKFLGCHCAPEPCHADALVELLKERRRTKGAPPNSDTIADTQQVPGPIGAGQSEGPEPGSDELRLYERSRCAEHGGS